MQGFLFLKRDLSLSDLLQKSFYVKMHILKFF